MSKSNMKKLTFIMFSIVLFFISTGVYAKDLNISIEDVKVVEKNSEVTVSDTIFSNDTLTSNINFSNQNDYVVFEVELKNNSDKKYKALGITDNNTLDNIEITYDFDETVNPNESYKFKVKVLYKEKVVNRDSITLNDLMISLNLMDESGDTSSVVINNPVTGDGILHYLVLLIISITGLYFIKKKVRFKIKNKKIKVGTFILLFAVVILPFCVFAVEKYTLNLKIKGIVLESKYLDYTVSFNTNGGNSIESRTVTYGQQIGELPTGEKEGYNFNGWKDQNGNTVTNTTKVTKELQLTADFSLVEYSITYDLNHGKVTPTNANPTKYTIEDEIELVTPTRKGYTFAGWSIGNSEEKLTTIRIFHETGDKSYKANWSRNEDTVYTVINKYENLDGTYITETDTQHGPTDTEVTAPFSPKIGFDNPDAQQVTISGEGDSSVTYTYTRHEYSLTVNEDVETTFTNSKYPYQTEITLTAKDKANYEFTGWSNGETTKTIIFNITEDTEVYPLYKATGFTVTYNANGGNFSDEDTLKNDVIYALNEATNKNEVVVGTYEIPVKKDYRFNGWYLDSDCTPGNEIDIENYEVTKNIEVYANWYYGEATFMDGRLISGCNNLKDDGTCSSWTYANMKINISSTSFIRSNTLPEEYNFEEYIVSSDDSDLPIYMWYEEDTKTTKWYSDATKVFLNPNSYSMFTHLENLKKLELKDFDTSKVTNMGHLFNSCRSVEELDVSHFDTSNVTRMDGMFSACSKLNSLDVSNFNTEKVTNMQMMFGNCHFAELDVYNFNTSNVTNMQQMFMNDDKLKELDLSNFNTSKVINMNQMFGGCTNLEKLNISRFDTNKVTNMSGMFNSCRLLEKLDLSHFDTSNVTRMDGMFYNCDGLEELDLSSFDTSKVTMMSDGYSYGIFSNCSSLKTIYASEKFDTSKANGIKMFYNCTSLVGGHGTVFNSSHVNKEYAHLDGGEHYPGYFTSKKNEYLIRFNPNNADDNLISFYVEEGSKLKFLPTPASTNGKFFVGWYTDKNYLVRVTEDTIPQGDAIYYARWIKSIASAEIIPDSVKINVGDEISLSINNVEEEYDIISDNSSIVKVDSNGKITGISKGETTITITGKVSKQTKIINVEVVQTEFTISFNSNGGGDVDSIIVDAGETISTLPTPTAPTNKIFDGWYTGIDSGIKVTAPYTPESNATLYAHWKNDAFPVVFSEAGECTFNGSSGVITGSNCSYANGVNKYIDTGINPYNSTNHDKDYEIGFTIVSYNPNGQVSQATFVNTKLEGNNYPGLVFRRKDNETGFDLSSRKTSSANERKLFNYGDVEKVKIYRITNQDTGVQEIFYSINDADKVKLNDLSSFNPTFDLSVWFGATPTNASATSAQRYLVGTLSDMYIKLGTYSEDNTETYKVTYNANGGSVTPSSKKINEGEQVGTLPTPTAPTGKSFTGWYTGLTDGVEVTSSYIPSSNITIYARYINDISGATISPSSISIINGNNQTITVSNVEEAYTFTSNDTNVATVDSTGKVTGTGVGTTTITITGSTSGKTKTINVTVEPSSYTVTLNANGGSVNPTSITVNNGDSVGTLPEPTPPTNKTFDGWYTDLTVGVKVTSSYVPNNNMTIYARYKNPTYTISFDAGEGSAVNDIEVEQGNSIGTLPTSTRNGYILEGWYEENTYETKVTSSTIPTGNVTYYAKWEELEVCADNENITRLSENTCSANENITVGDGIVCKRAVKLHEETCSRTNTTSYCSGTGYTTSGSKGTSTITYGSCGTSGTLTSGDAFTCDVNGDEKFDELTERFYYVSDYYDTSAKEFDTSTAVLIYYNNVTSGVSCNKNTFAYYSRSQNWHGPLTVMKQLPTTSQWSNVSLKSEKRAILGEYLSTHDSPTTRGGTLPTDFSYEGYAARLLTAKELMAGCNLTEVGRNTDGELDSCNYVMENTIYAKRSIGNYGHWLETSIASISDYSWGVIGSFRHVYNRSTSDTSVYGARPAIEVPKSKIEYGASSAYTVTLNANGGSVNPTSITVNIGDAIGTLPTPTAPTGKSFTGWYTELTGGIEVTSTYVPNTDIEIYARYNSTYTVSFDTDGGSTVASQTVNHGGVATRPTTDPTKTGYTFDNWYTDDTYQTIFDFDNTVITSNTVIYAKYYERLICSENRNAVSLSSAKCSNNENNTLGDETICKRAINLHEEKCSPYGTSYYCAGAGYAVGSTITYGSCGTSGTLTSGDAFTCDVNGDGYFDELAERFYYLSDYYDTNTKTFDTTTASLVYYNSVTNGISCNAHTYAYDSEKSITYGPRTLVQHLPTVNQWSNVSLKNSSRQILDEKNMTTVNEIQLPMFDYSNYAARLLTYQEISAACDYPIDKTSSLDVCNYILENTKYTSYSNGSIGHYLETVKSETTISQVWYVHGGSRALADNNGGGYAAINGVRPVIDVPKTKISY